MKVGEWMARKVHACEHTMDCAAAACRMFENDCGMLPVVDGEGRVLGIVTDRDLAIAAATRGARLTDLAVTEVMQSPAITCAQDAEPTRALALLRRHRVRRLPIVDERGALVGVVSIGDFLHRSRTSQPQGDMPSEAQVLEVLRNLLSSDPPAQDSASSAHGPLAGRAAAGATAARGANAARGPKAAAGPTRPGADRNKKRRR